MSFDYQSLKHVRNTSSFASNAACSLTLTLTKVNLSFGLASQIQISGSWLEQLMTTFNYRLQDKPGLKTHYSQPFKLRRDTSLSQVPNHRKCQLVFVFSHCGWYLEIISTPQKKLSISLPPVHDDVKLFRSFKHKVTSRVNHWQRLDDYKLNTPAAFLCMRMNPCQTTIQSRLPSSNSRSIHSFRTVLTTRNVVDM